MQAPYPFKEDGHFLRDMKGETLLNQENYITFNDNLREIKRRSIRQSYSVRGTDSLIDTKSMSLRMAKEEFERFLYKNLPGCERGTVTLPLIERPHLLPIPYPRALYTSFSTI